MLESVQARLQKLNQTKIGKSFLNSRLESLLFFYIKVPAIFSGLFTYFKRYKKFLKTMLVCLTKMRGGGRISSAK